MPKKEKDGPKKEKEQLKDGVFMFEKGGKTYIENNLRDKQVIVTFSDGKPAGDAKEDGGKIKASVHPGESLPVCAGNKKKPKVATGPCDKKWLEKQKNESQGVIDEEVKKVKEVLKAKGITKVTADVTAKACAEAGIKFLDVTFPPKDTSIKPEHIKRSMKLYPWKRPESFLEGTGLKPALFVGSIEPEDIDQGSLADCYLMGALSAVAEFERLVRSCFEQGQDPDLGLYRVSLCKNGWWQTVLVDDFLPCSGPKPAYSRNRDEPNELWVSLIEKAYAKVHGSFGAIMTGGAAPALGDLTGCPYKTFSLEGEEDVTSFEQLLENDENEFLQVLGTPGKNITYMEEGKISKEDQALWDKYQDVGLVCEHSYSLLVVKKTSKGDQLCKIRNPWGNDKEWTGKWSDDDKAWTPELKRECGFVAADDGTFWMEYSDVKKWFNTIAINYCHGTWDQIRCAGNWEKGCSDLAVEIKAEKECRVWFGLHQKDIRGVKPGSPDAEYSAMNLFVAQMGKKASTLVSLGTKKRDVYEMKKLEAGKTYFFYGQPKDDALSKSFVLSLLVEEKDFVDVTFRTAKGKRYASPKEFDASAWSITEAQYQIKGQFSTNGTVITRQGKKVTFDGAAQLGLQTEQNNFKLTMAADRKKPDVDAEEKKLYEILVTVVKGKGLAAKDESGKSDPYCEVKLRAYDRKKDKVLGSHRHPQKQVTSVKEQTLDPVWNESFTFIACATDVVRVHSFDKDEVGKDALGRLDIKLTELNLKKGEEKKAAYKLIGDPQDGEVTGTIEVAVKLVNDSL